jgi:hypothetical protein
VVHDSSGYDNEGVLQGAGTWVAGRYAKAISFDGSTAAVRVPRTASLEPSSAISVTAWVKGTNPGNFKYILVKGASGCIAGSYGLYTGPSGGASFYVSTYPRQTSNVLFIGHYDGCSGLNLAGTIDEPNVWTRALSQTDVKTAMACPAYGAPLTLCVIIRL